MDFQETATQKEIRELMRKFVQKELLPVAEADERNEVFRTALIQTLGSYGLTGIPVSEDYGGCGLGYLEYITAIEELAIGNLGYALSVAVTGLPQVILSSFGNEDQKRKYIQPLACGSAIGAFSLSEASSGSDAGSLRTTAKKEGDFYLLNGTKLWVTQGDIADTLILIARTENLTEHKNTKGLSAFILEKGMPGFTTGKREKKMGCQTSHTVELVLQNVKIPAQNRVGQEGDGFKIAMTALNSGRITIGAAALGLAKGALDVATRHAIHREQFGQPISEFQGISFLLADMATQLHAAQLLVHRAAWLKDQNLPFTLEASMAKLFSTDMAMQVTTDAVQILGGSGYTQDFPVERYMREAKLLQIVEGTNQVQRMIIGRTLTTPARHH
jgi:acyl-CoA dehydrogenase